MKTLTDIYNSIKENFVKKSNIDIQRGSVLDLLTLSVSSGIEEAFKEIENNKNPYIFSRLIDDTDDLDEFGYTLNIPREENEPNDKYFYRIINSRISNQSSNELAIETALMNLTYSSHTEYVPLTYGAGTGTIYIIPNDYSDETKENAIKEAKDKLKNKISKTAYIDYKIPEPRKVDLVIYIYTEQGDIKYIQENLYKKIQKYINNIAPGQYLEAGRINTIGIDETNVSYFSLDKIIVDNKSVNNIKIFQTVNEKFLLNNISWVVPN